MVKKKKKKMFRDAGLHCDIITSHPGVVAKVSLRPLSGRKKEGILNKHQWPPRTADMCVCDPQQAI